MHQEDQSDRLLRDKEGYYANLMDEDGCQFEVRFNFDGCAQIKVPNLNYLDLSMEILTEIQHFLSIAEMLYRIEFDGGQGDFNASLN